MNIKRFLAAFAIAAAIAVGAVSGTQAAAEFHAPVAAAATPNAVITPLDSAWG